MSTKDDFVDLIIQVCDPESTEEEWEEGVRKLAVEQPHAAISALATFAEAWLEGLLDKCDSACDRDQVYTRFRATLDECVDATDGTSGATEGTAVVV